MMPVHPTDNVQQTLLNEALLIRRCCCVLIPCITVLVTTALASIGSGLSMSKEYRGVFEDLIEKV